MIRPHHSKLRARGVRVCDRSNTDQVVQTKSASPAFKACHRDSDGIPGEFASRYGFADLLCPVRGNQILVLASPGRDEARDELMHRTETRTTSPRHGSRYAQVAVHPNFEHHGRQRLVPSLHVVGCFDHCFAANSIGRRRA